MVVCKQCFKEIKPGEKVVAQYEALMTYEHKEAHPTQTGTLVKYWHKDCKPWHE